MNNKLYCQYAEKACEEIESLHPKEGLFFAYPSEPATSADAINKAIELVRSDESINIPAIDWKELPIEGNIVFCEICKAIRNSSCSVVNTTYVNFNVLFEYGFAVGSGKAIWPLVETGVSKDELVTSNVKSITTIGYSGFTDGKSIYRKILKKRPWNRKSQFRLPDELGEEPNREATGILYIKSIHNNEPSLRISETISLLPFEVITDDPNEVVFRHITWYLNQIGKSYAVIIHLGSERMIQAHIHWAKCALVAGLSLALGRRLLLIGEDINFEPIDYHDLIRNYKNALEAERIVSGFLETVQGELGEYKKYTEHDIKLLSEKKHTVLEIAELGDMVAENEVHRLDDYFVETSEFKSALQPRFSVYVGRKGTGKTANYYMVCSRLEEDARNLVCKIKPKEYELNELVQFVKNELDIASKGYLLESLWKFMLYSEALISIHEEINEKPPGALIPSEKVIEDYFGSGSIDAEESFTSRLVKTVRDVCSLYEEKRDVKIAVSEILHRNEISSFKRMICEYVKDRCDRFSILIDGLDANWKLGENHEIMADILLALIGAAKDLWRDYIEEMDQYKKESSVLIFVRSDVFRIALERARDPDKLQYELINWPSVKSLMNVVIRRLMANLGRAETEVFNWDELIEPGFSYEEMERLISNNILPRPRDYIYYFQRVLYYSRIRGTKYMTKRDFESGLSEYSDYVLLSLSGEAQPYIPSILDLMLEFDQGIGILTLEEINEILLKANIEERDLRKTIDYLVNINFLGYGIDDHNFRFPVSPSDEAIIIRRFLRHATRRGGVKRFKIHNAFNRALNIQKAVKKD